MNQNEKYKLYEVAAAKAEAEGKPNDEACIMKHLISPTTLVDVKTADERWAWAKALLDELTQEGTTKPDGYECLPGFEPRPYYPKQLIRDDDGHIIQMENATFEYIEADARRSTLKRDAARRRDEGTQRLLQKARKGETLAVRRNLRNAEAEEREAAGAGENR